MYHLWQLKHLEETNYVEEIKREFIDRILAYDAERFFIYVTQYLKKDINLEELTIVDDKTNEEKKVYHFNFDTLAQCFFDYCEPHTCDLNHELGKQNSQRI